MGITNKCPKYIIRKRFEGVGVEFGGHSSCMLMPIAELMMHHFQTRTMFTSCERATDVIQIPLKVVIRSKDLSCKLSAKTL